MRARGLAVRGEAVRFLRSCGPRRPWWEGLLGLTLGLLLAVAALAGPATRPVVIKLREFVFDPKEVTVRAGEVTFDIKNEGSIEHNFIIEDGARKSIAQIPIIDAGKTEELKVTLRPGNYAIVCSLPGHKDAGMTGSLRVQP